MKLSVILEYLENIAPVSHQESYDNSGLIIGDPSSEVSKALICLDSTEAIVEEAIQNGCDLIIAHHPIVFTGLRKLNGKSYVERTVIKAIRNGIAIYAIHTNLDNVRQGVNMKICEMLGLTDCRILKPKEAIQPDIGSGMIGLNANPQDEEAFLQFIKEKLKTPCIRHTALRKAPVKRVAVCGGSGSFLLGDAIHAGADVFITADFKYHQFFDAEQKIVIADVGHYESEQFTKDLLYDILKQKFPNFALLFSNLNTNPIKYLI